MNPNRPEAGNMQMTEQDVIETCEVHGFPLDPEQLEVVTAVVNQMLLSAAPSPAQTERGAITAELLLSAITTRPDLDKVSREVFRREILEGDGEITLCGADFLEMARAALQAAPAAEIRDAARYRMARIHAYRFGVANPTPEEFDALCDQHSADMSTTAPVADQSEPVACELCRGIGQIGIPGQRCFNCDGSGKSPHQGLYAPQPAADAPGMAEPVAWESTTPVYRRFITDARYQKLSQQARKWYKPYRCTHCSTTAAQPSPTAGVLDDEPLWDHKGNVRHDAVDRLGERQRAARAASPSPVEQTRALTDQEIYDKFDFLEGVVNETTYRQIARKAIEIARAAARPASGETE